MADKNKKAPLTEEEKKLFETFMPEEYKALSAFGAQRRDFLKLLAIMSGGALTLPLLGSEPVFAFSTGETVSDDFPIDSIENALTVSIRVNGLKRTLQIDPRMTLLDTLRERLKLTGSKKGCDHGQCGACTVIMDERRVLSCLTLAATCEGRSVTTIEGLAKSDTLHPMQTAFLKHDGYQCGYCTAGQICSAVALLQEAKNGDASYVTADSRGKTGPVQLSDDEIRERMSGNICRCGAYPNIIAAIQEVHSGKAVAQSWQFTDKTA